MCYVQHATTTSSCCCSNCFHCFFNRAVMRMDGDTIEEALSQASDRSSDRMEVVSVALSVSAFVAVVVV